jgi:hypothetical protein
MPQGNWNDPTFQQAAITQALDAAYGKGFTTPEKLAYWQGKVAKDPAYFWQRMLGQGAGGQDVARYGPYAGLSSGAPSAMATGAGSQTTTLAGQMPGQQPYFTTIGQLTTAPSMVVTPALSGPVPAWMRPYNV